MKSPEEAHPTAEPHEEEILRSLGALAAEAGLAPASVLKTLKADLSLTAHPRRALTNLHRFLATGFSSAWIRDFAEHRILQQIILQLFAQSQFLADILVRNPELFRWLTSTNVLKVTAAPAQYAADAAHAVSLFQRAEKKLDSLKRFHRRELLRIGARQVLKEADVQTTSSELSALADGIVAAVLDLAYEQIGEFNASNLPRNMAVVGLGKLGGGELNFSSDIDLMFVYEADGPLSPPIGRSGTLHEYYSRVAEFVVRRLSEHTAEGHLYRVDMRLRPDGQSGPLAMSRPAYMAYYEARGELWERQMLIKARIIAGSKEVGERWRKDIRPFIYHKTHLSSPLEEIARIKSRIESRLDESTNIKLGSGGIRDIEFSVQALQLLHGGGNPSLQTGSTLGAVQVLGDSGLLKGKEVERLIRAYRFLRMVEDRLQLLHGLQEHSLPESPQEKKVLAKQLDFASASAFENTLLLHQKNIKAVFASVFGMPSAKAGSGEDALLTLKELRRTGFRDAAGTLQKLNSLSRDLEILRQPDRMTAFLKKLRSLGAPDRCVDHLMTLAASVPVRRTFVQAAANESSFDLILLICSRASRYVELLSREPLLFEALVGRSEDLLGAGRSWKFMLGTDLVRYKQYNEFKSVLRLLVGEISVRSLTRELSDLADEILRTQTGRLIESDPDLGRSAVALLGLGKLGGSEIAFGSDLDLVLVYKENETGTAGRVANRFGRTLRQDLERVYALDFRLRPEGKNSPLATDVSYYEKYLHSRASLWERQALLKSRFVAGEKAFGDSLAERFQDFAFRSDLPTGWKKEIVSMRERMARERSKNGSRKDLKVGVGGLVDLEFLVQALQLRYGREEQGIAQQNTFAAVDALHSAGILTKKSAATIHHHLEWVRKLDLFLKLSSDTPDSTLPTDGEHLSVLAAAMGYISTKRFLGAADKIRRDNRTLFTKIMKAIPR